ncbi:MAG TPA: hypothetical protein VIK12_06365 [Pengzhenrongella sp.]
MAETPAQAAAIARGAAMKDHRDKLVAALETERNGYVVRGLKDRVEQVDAEIKRAKAVRIPKELQPGPVDGETPDRRRGSVKAAAAAAEAAAAEAAAAEAEKPAES